MSGDTGAYWSHVAAETPATQADIESASEGNVPEQQGSGAERRVYKRLRPEQVGNLAARLASGAEIKLVDLSRGGAQFETDRRFLPNSTVSLRLVTHDATFVVHGRVVRSRIVRLDSGGLGYNVAVAFNEVLQHLIEIESSASTATEPAAFAATHQPDGAESGPEATALAPTEIEDGSDVTPEEQVAFEATVETETSMMTVTASVDTSGEALLDLFNGNDW